MPKTIALIESLDTKLNEALFAKECIEKEGFQALLIDNSTFHLDVNRGDVTPLEVLSELSLTQEDFEKMNKPERIATMGKALEKFVPRLYMEGKIDGVMSIGGGQNGSMAAPCMKALPFGVPKVLSSALACGVREMEQFVGEKDIFVAPTVADISGLNPITKTMIQSVCASIMGLVQYGKTYEKEGDSKVIGATMLGETTKGTEKALELIREGTNWETVIFHANGVGGRSMESLMETGQIQGVLDMTLHEIVCEVYGGFCAGANNRLLKALELGLPVVAAPGGLDMNDYYNDATGRALPADFAQRKKILHNPTIYHVKVFKEEAIALAKLVCERLGSTDKPVTLVVPTKGCCQTTKPGGAIEDPEVDEVMVQAFKDYVKDNTKLGIVDTDIKDPEFAQVVASEFKDLVKQYGW